MENVRNENVGGLQILIVYRVGLQIQHNGVFNSLLSHTARNEGFRLMPTASARKGSLCFQHDLSSARHSKQASSALAPLKGSRFAVKACRWQAFSLSLVRICNPHLAIFRISNPSSPAFHSASDGNCSQRKCWRIANPDSMSCWIANPTQRSILVNFVLKKVTSEEFNIM